MSIVIDGKKVDFDFHGIANGADLRLVKLLAVAQGVIDFFSKNVQEAKSLSPEEYRVVTPTGDNIDCMINVDGFGLFSIKENISIGMSPADAGGPAVFRVTGWGLLADSDYIWSVSQDDPNVIDISFFPYFEVSPDGMYNKLIMRWKFDLNERDSGEAVRLLQVSMHDLLNSIVFIHHGYS